VSHRKALPHVIYCRVWRWPDLQSHHELKPLDCCQFAFAAKQNEVCINPFHYERIEAPILPPVLVPKYVEFAQGFSVLHGDSHTPTNYYQHQHQHQPASSHQNNFSMLNNSTFTPSSSSSMNMSDECDMYSPMSDNSSQNTSTEIAATATSQPIAMSSSTSVAYQQPTHWCSISYYELNVRVGEIFHVSSCRVHVDGFTDPSMYGRRVCLGILTNINRNSIIENTRRHIGKGKYKIKAYKK
jgi:hypothetical protein